ncbi:MAG: MBL fold metallo-hydrolase [Flavobacteriaceae bacterium]|jgi:phosphoribosyl 1,2-cyclic phosphate phosphodiesterase|nr:MBL fold metallo-hydrolase [Flavobacteriaceae bacterium]|tara:strand:- start:44880 stop:45641 length:762 start_codon:yes stop_codon:yes gene_type:complete
MKITFLGTGTSQGIPVIGSDHPVCLSNDPKDKRLRTSALIEWDNKKIAIDCGPDFRMQMINANCDKLDAIFFTHEHNDHVSGLDDIRPFYFKHGDIPIYACKRVISALKKRFDYIFKSKGNIPGTPKVSVNLIDKDFKFHNKEIKVLNAFHGKLPIIGFRIDNLAYFTDVKTIPETEFHKLKSLDVLVINALRIKEHYSHLSLNDALAIIDRLNPKKAYLTHISHKLGFHKDVQSKLPKNVSLAYDGLVVDGF